MKPTRTTRAGRSGTARAPRQHARRTRGRRRPRTSAPSISEAPSGRRARPPTGPSRCGGRRASARAAPRSGRPALHDEAVGQLPHARPERGEALGEGGDAVALLDAQLAGAGHRERALARRRRPRRGPAPRRSGRARARGRPSCRASRDEDATIEPTGSGSLASSAGLDAAAHGPQHVDEGGAGRARAARRRAAPRSRAGRAPPPPGRRRSRRRRARRTSVPAQARAAPHGRARGRRARPSTPKAGSIRSVWSRLGAGSRTVVTPSACRPASRTAVFTCALATGRSCVEAAQAAAVDRQRRPAVGGQARWRPWRAAGRPRARAGRRRSDSSPVSTERNGRPARAPASMRIVEPEFSASRTAAGARQAARPPLVDRDARPVPARSRRRARAGRRGSRRSRRPRSSCGRGSGPRPSRRGSRPGARWTCRRGG